MQHDLLGYLLDALGPDERRRVGRALSEDPQLLKDLEALRQRIGFLPDQRDRLVAPENLAERTCRAVAELAESPGIAIASRRAFSRGGLSPAAGRWTLSDVVVAAGVFLAAGMLLFPALSQSRHMARLAGCQNNLRGLGISLTRYSSMNGGFFPSVESAAPYASAAILFGPKLQDAGLLEQPETLLCPGSARAERASAFQVPKLETLRRASPAELARMHQTMGGDYGFHIGHVMQGRLQPTKNLRLSRLAIMADAPGPSAADRRSLNHGGCGQNVLYHDGHVTFLTGCSEQGCVDHIFLNDDGAVVAASHPRDAVICSSPTRAVVIPVAEYSVPAAPATSPTSAEPSAK